MWEAFAKSATPSTKSHFLQPACVWPCDPLVHIWNRRSNLTGVHLRAGYRLYEPNTILAADGRLSGYFPDIFSILRGVMNFTFSSEAGSSFGSAGPDGRFSGIVGMLQRREIDVNVGSQSFRFDRSLVNDLSVPLLTTYLGVFYRSSDKYKLNTWEMLAIFEREAWMLLLALACLSALALCLVHWVQTPDLTAPSGAMHATAFVSRSLILKGYCPSSVRKAGASMLLCLTGNT